MNTTEEIKIKKVHTFLDLAIASVVTAAGVGLYFLLPGWGVLFCLIGILLFAFYRRANKRVGERTLLKEASLDIDPGCRSGILDFLGGKADTMECEAASEGSHLYLQVYYNADETVAYAQLYDVAENSFEPATGMTELRGPKAQTLIGKL